MSQHNIDSEKSMFFLDVLYSSWLQKELDVGKGSQGRNDLGHLPTKFQKQIFLLALFPFVKGDLSGIQLFQCPEWLLKGMDFLAYKVFSRLMCQDQILQYWRRLSRKQEQKCSCFFFSLETSVSVQLGDRLLLRYRIKKQQHRN